VGREIILIPKEAIIGARVESINIEGMILKKGKKKYRVTWLLVMDASEK